MSDPALSLGNLLQLAEIVSILGGGALVAVGIGRFSGNIAANMRLQATEIKALQIEIKALQDEIKTLSKLLTEVAVQRQQIVDLHRRLDAHDRALEELRRGEGLIALPPLRGDRG